MTRVALVDGDIVAFRCAASCKGEDPSSLANFRADQLIRDVIQATQAELVEVFLSGTRNFRYELFPDYKANRRESVDPIYRQSCKEYLITNWFASVSDGIEADDAIGIAHTTLTSVNNTPIICSIDKDFKQLSGEFYDFVKEEFFTVDPLEAQRYFYKQLLLGDRSDNIPGYDGKARQKPTKQIQAWYSMIDESDSESEMYAICWDAFHSASTSLDEATYRLHLTAQLCYILRKENHYWTMPVLDSHVQERIYEFSP